ncbi:MAG: bifunctional glutamate N-acetyltransferase/amino-acid acetyltransferase ArgJ [Alphaproteobacteria bacterium]|nr:bifunctional glutamate N-acetyltransferase/amino-acid acetyltransferase ArgJ [Alphaproteobacteria bacterium]
MLKGIKISTTNCGLKYKNRDDLLLIVFDQPASIAGVFTTSSMPAAPVVWCKKNVKAGVARALIVNAGNANAFTGKEGEEAVVKTANKVANELGCSANEVFVSSTGVIGERLKVELIKVAIPQMTQNFSSDEAAWNKAAQAIMTTDTKMKMVSRTCKIGDKNISLIGFAKGSGMIAPNMATMLGYIFTDANICSKTLQILLKETAEHSFNAITVDSDQSTNDTVLFFATKVAGNHEITDSHAPELSEFKYVLNELALELAKKIVVDGEGAKKLIEVEVEGARTNEQAKCVAFSIANSPLVKTAIAAADPNWGRIVMAVGKSCDEASPEKIIVKIGDHPITKDGMKHPDYVEQLVHKYLTGAEVKISVNLGIGSSRWVVWTCDLNEEYIKINKDYRT